MSRAMAWLRSLVAASERYTSSSTVSLRPAKASWMARMRAHFSSAVLPSTRLVVAMAPGFTKGFISFPRICSMATMELNTWPVASTPILSSTACGPAVSITLASVKGGHQQRGGEKVRTTRAQRIIALRQAGDRPLPLWSRQM